jgi:phage recombination protein Bet
MAQPLALVDVVPAVTADQVALIKTTIAKDATDTELQLFFYDCQRQGVHPLDRLIHFTKRGGKYTPITSIDFMRQRAAQTGECAGIDDAVVTGDPKTPGFQATVTVYRLVQGQRCAFTATARWSEYKPDANDFMWAKMPHVMLGKCAEALALRKGFPQQLAGLYATEELDQAEPREPRPAREPIPGVEGTISAAQRKRLFAIALSHGWGKTDMQAALLERFGIRRTTDIYATDYDAIVEAFEQPPASAIAPEADQAF